MSNMRSPEAGQGILAWYLPCFDSWSSWVWLGILESSAASGFSQHLQHEEKIFEARFWWAANMKKKEWGPLGSRAWIPDAPLEIHCDGREQGGGGSYRLSLPQGIIVFSFPKSFVAPPWSYSGEHSGSLKVISPVLYKIFLPMERSWSLYSFSIACRAALLNQLIFEPSSLGRAVS